MLPRLSSMYCDAGITSLGPALEHPAEEVLVEEGRVMPLLASQRCCANVFTA